MSSSRASAGVSQRRSSTSSVGSNSPESGPHQPPAHALRPPFRVPVARRRQLLAELAAQAGLLLDLAQGAVLVALARIRLPLRERPVVVLGPVHDDNASVADDQPSGGSDLVYAVFASRFHAASHSSRACKARARSRSSSRPGGQGGFGQPRHERPQPLLRDDRVLVLAEHVLERLRGLDVRLRVRELGGVARALDLDPHGVQGRRPAGPGPARGRPCAGVGAPQRGSPRATARRRSSGRALPEPRAARSTGRCRARRATCAWRFDAHA